MKANQIFAAMEPEQAVEFFRKVNETAPGSFQQAVAAACGALKIRPVYMKKQAFEKRTSYVRRALSLVAASPIAEEILAVYFLECRKELLIEWLDATKTEHEEGTLKAEQPAEPDDEELAAVAAAFLGKDDDLDRDLLLRAFSAQSAVDWPKLEALLEAREA